MKLRLNLGIEAREVTYLVFRIIAPLSTAYNFVISVILIPINFEEFVKLDRWSEEYSTKGNSSSTSVMHRQLKFPIFYSYFKRYNEIRFFSFKVINRPKHHKFMILYRV